MLTNPKPCSECPFNAATRQPSATDELVGEALARIRDGERWVCHQTAGPVGKPYDETMRYCASAPLPPTNK